MIQIVPVFPADLQLDAELLREGEGIRLPGQNAGALGRERGAETLLSDIAKQDISNISHGKYLDLIISNNVLINLETQQSQRP